MIAGVLLCATAAWAQGNEATEKQLIANERMISEAVNKKDLKMFHAMVDSAGIGVDALGFTRVASAAARTPARAARRRSAGR